MADRVEERVKPAADNEGVEDTANCKKTTDPHQPTARPEISHNVPPPSLPSGEKRKAPSSPDEGMQKKAKPFTMNFGTKAKGGTGEIEKNNGVKSGGSTMKCETAKPVKSISLKLAQKPKEAELKAPTSRAVAKAFAEDSDEDEEEMPPEAKMRMKNIGRETPTSAGPNSYNKSKYGFNDHARVWKKSVDAKLEKPNKDKK
ncbi:PEST proteolytic signal-containing nuclear protein-like [Acanthaster planci]|uniref:PEST proteolytic signal-containing nuclear protein n=1 Tax=Acanthaster planci TaxID=133434 RepID=A0A8B7XMA3_ACAPL|nr:PEST proteolytic signal-containing nuclear protein-like [Acanthaster planci]